MPPRNQVFISYSHNDKDRAFLAEFRVHLKPWEDRGQLNVWSDHRITPSQDWDQEIKDALASTAVAVLLISPDFLASKYIREVELPALLRAREEEQLDLCCLYLRSSQVDELTFEVPFPSGEIVSVKLTKYQGLNSPGDVLSSQDSNKHDSIYSQAASVIKRLFAQRTRTATRSPTSRYELTIQFKRNGNQLTRIYLHHYGRFAEYRSPWQGATHSLFDTLFDSQEHCDKVLQRLFNSTEGVSRPIRHPVRVRIHTTDTELANLPWAQITWEGNNLCDHGWTFELINDKALDHFQGTSHPLPDITLKAPCPVLMIAPSNAPDVEVHHLALEERLKNAWPSPHEPPQWARTWQEIDAAWRKRKPRIVYYYGPAESDGNTLTLPLGGLNSADRCAITDLAQLWQADPPQIVFGNFVGDLLLPGIAPSILNIPLFISQNGSDPTTARRTALEWLRALLEGEEDTDPIWALQQRGVPTAVAWGAYGKWTTRTINEPAKDKLAHLLLDRKQQRALGHDAVRELVRDGERRVCSVLAYGAEGNLAALFAEQLYEHLRRNVNEVALVYRVPLRLPTTQSFDVAKLEFEVRRQLSLSDREPLGTALEKRAPRAPGRARPVLLLDWGVRGTTDHDRISAAGLEAWLLFSRQHLCSQCPKELRILSCLSLETAADRHAALELTVNNLLREARFRDRAFRCELLPPLSQVSANDLAAFLDGPGNSSCPDDLIPVMPELIVHRTGGVFTQTVELIEQAERTSWYELHDELVAQSSQPPVSPVHKDELI